MSYKNILSSHLPKKSLGQHFLIHEGIQDRIIQACCLNSEDVVLEIGPGKGAITRKLSQAVKQVTAVEKDRSLAAALQESFLDSNVTVMEADALEVDFSSWPKDMICVGNLPYNVAAPIIEKVLCSGHFRRMYAMVQLEHGERMWAGPGSKEYGSLSCFVQFYSRVKKLFEIRPSAFQPPPKVQSVFLEFQIYDPKERPLKVEDPEELFRMIRTAFLHRRKTILNALGSFCPKEMLQAALKESSIAENKRPEQIALADYGVLLRNIKKAKS